MRHSAHAGGRHTADTLERIRAIAAVLRGDAVRLDRWPVAELLACATDNGVEALLADRLAGEDAGGGPLEEALLAAAQRLAAKEVFVHRELRRVLAHLADAGIESLLVKGTALAYTVYPRPYLRPRSDTDMFVRGVDVPAVAAILGSCGYAPVEPVRADSLATHQNAFRRIDEHGGSHAIDLHWKLANPHLFADVLPFALLWQDSQPAPALGDAARVPSNGASVVLACMHRVAHHQDQERLIWLYDLRLLSESLSDADWDGMVALARARGVAAPVMAGLRRARELVGAVVPAPVESELAPAAARESANVYVSRRVRRREVLMSDLRLVGSWRGRRRLIGEYLFPSSGFMRRRYAGLRWPLPVLYLRRVVAGIFKWSRE